MADDQLAPSSTMMKAVLERTIRIETRLTKYMEAQGFDTQCKRPEWFPEGRVEIPSLACSILDLTRAVPDGWDREQMIDVTHKGTVVMQVFVGA